MRKHKMRKATTGVINWLNCIWLTDLPSNSKYVACYLRKFMNDNQDMAWPSYARMIQETGLSRATISKHLSILESEGWIQRERENGENTTYIAKLPKQLEQGVKNLDQSLTGLVQSLNQTSSITELPLVQSLNTNKQCNKQRNKQEEAKSKKFIPPSIEEVLEYITEKGYPYRSEAEKFFYYYDSKGWIVGKSKMKNWKSSASGWMSRAGLKKIQPQQPVQQKTNVDEFASMFEEMGK